MNVNQMPYDKNQPPVESLLSPQNLENLPMFNPLRYRAAIPLDTIFPQHHFSRLKDVYCLLERQNVPVNSNLEGL